MKLKEKKKLKEIKLLKNKLKKDTMKFKLWKKKLIDMQIYQAKNQKNNKKLLKIFFENKKIIIKINFI